MLIVRLAGDHLYGKSVHLAVAGDVLTASFCAVLGWSGDAMVLGKLQVPGLPTIWITVGQGPTALAVGTGRGCLDIFTFIYHSFSLSPSL